MVSKWWVGGLQVNTALERSQPGPRCCQAGYCIVRDVYPVGVGLAKGALGEENSYTSYRESKDAGIDQASLKNAPALYI